MRRRLLGALAGAGAVCLVVGAPQLGRPTAASWKNSEFGQSSSFTAKFVHPPRSLSCTRSIVLERVTFTWQAPTTGGAARSGYAWAVTGQFTRSGTLAADATSVVINVPLLALGTANFTVWAVSDEASPQWQSTKLAGRIYVLTSLIPDCSVP